MAALGWNKWNKYKVLRASSGLVSCLPETHWLNESALRHLLTKYGDVIIKPSSSYGGNGVIRIASTGNQEFKVHDGQRKTSFIGFQPMFNYVKARTTKNYIVQRRISLASINGRPFDLRVMAQRHKNSDWHITGQLAKVAGRGYIVTNLRRSRGSILPVGRAIQASSSLRDLPVNELLRRIDRIALSTAKQLQRSYPSNRSMGIDMGLDKQGKIWIIEVNFSPSKSLFLKLKDKSMYHRILSFG